MWPDQAADEAESTLSMYFAPFDHPLPWDEIKENIVQGSVAGSGYGYTLLHAFVKQGNELAIKFLLDKGADIDALTKSNGQTPLHLAIENQNLAIVTLLLENGADPMAQDNKNVTAFALAISHGDVEIVKTLVARRLNVNTLARAGTIPAKPLMLAIEYGKEKVVDFLIESGAQIEAMDENGNTPLIKAVADDRRLRIVRQLLERGANVNAKNHHGVTPLHVAVQSGSERMVNLLLEKQPDLEARTTNGETALLIASKESFMPIVQSLLDNGAECVAGYPRGGTPQDVASLFPILDALQRARTQKKKWFQKLNADKMDEKYRSARLAAIYKVHQEREMRARREFVYVEDEDSDEEALRQSERHIARGPSRLRMRQAPATSSFKPVP
jgi:ankyrin repeat protein